MSILKMKFISIVGPRKYFDDFVCKYIVNSGMQPENALLMLENIKGLTPYIEDSQYNVISQRVSSLISSMGLDLDKRHKTDRYQKGVISAQDICRELDVIEEGFNKLLSKKQNLKSLLNESLQIKKQLELIRNVNVDIERLFNFEFIKFRFGSMPKKSFNQLQLYLDELEVIVIPVSNDNESVWIMYFTPRAYGEKVDGILSSLYFERTRISGDLKGTPEKSLEYLQQRINSLQKKIQGVENEIELYIKSNKDRIFNIYYSSRTFNRITQVKKHAAHTADSFYLIGWIPEKELNHLAPLLDKEKRISYILEEPDMVTTIKPPTQLKNNIVFRQFESLVRMYGLPSYNEVDPTTFVALTYFIMFGLMFGDVGQGLVLFVSGFILMKSGISLGGVITGAGISSTLFGFLYGSVFGFEHWIEPLWVSPLQDINTMLTVGILVGVILITISMILNIINGIRMGDTARILFDKNGIAGFVFYWSAILFILYFIQTGKVFVSYGFIAFTLIIPVVALFLKEPLDNLMNKKPFLSGQKGGFIVETLFEIFETLLSFVSNTISFIRLSAFALNHAGLFMAVLLLSEMANGVGSLVGIILGNIIIILLEGLIVGIQALRLEYYELFGRFFTGGGRQYKPVKNIK